LEKGRRRAAAFLRFAPSSELTPAVSVDLVSPPRFFDMRLADHDPSPKPVTASPKGVVQSYFSDLRDWGTGLAKNFAVACSLFVVGGGFVLAGLTVGLAALFHWIEVNYSLYRAYGIIGCGLTAIGALGILFAVRLISRPNPRMPLGERQIGAMKRAIASTALRRTGALQSSPLSADLPTQILVGAAAAILVGWIVASRMDRIRNRARD
jgi:hypothetical protein